jgi:hypothetical protein
MFMLFCAVIIALAGAAGIWKGVKRLRGGGGNTEFTRLVGESDAAVAEASRLAREAGPMFTQSMSDVDRLGLDAFRAEQSATATKTAELFTRSSAQFRLAETRLGEAKKLNTDPQLATYFDAKSRSYDLFAQTLDLNREMAGMLTDTSITTGDELLPKLTETAARRDAVDKEAKAASESANELGKQIQAARK